MQERDGWRTNALRSYVVTRRYSVRQSDRSAEMQVRLQYHYPGVKRFEVLWSRGSSVLTDHVFPRLLDGELKAANDEETRDKTRITPENYRFQPAGLDCIGGRKAYVLDLQPRFKHKLLLRGRVWVDKEDFAVLRLDGSPAGRSSFWIRSSHVIEQYRKVQQFWLLASNQTDSKLRFFGTAELRIDNFGYQVNGLHEEELASRP